MRKFLYEFLFLTVLVFFRLSAGAAQENVVIGAEHFPPYVMNLKNGAAHPGFAVELCRILLPEKEFNLTFKYCSWTSGIGGLPRRRYDALLPAAKGDAPDLLYPVLPVFIHRPALWRKKNVPFPEKRKSILAVRKNVFLSDESDALTREYEKAGKVLFFESSSVSEKTFRAFASGKASLAVEDLGMGFWMAKRMSKQAKNWILVKTLGTGTEFYIGFSNHSPVSWRCRSAWTRNFEKFRKTPEYRNLLRKYGLPDTFPEFPSELGK